MTNDHTRIRVIRSISRRLQSLPVLCIVTVCAVMLIANGVEYVIRSSAAVESEQQISGAVSFDERLRVINANCVYVAQFFGQSSDICQENSDNADRIISYWKENGNLVIDEDVWGVLLLGAGCRNSNSAELATEIIRNDHGQLRYDIRPIILWVVLRVREHRATSLLISLMKKDNPYNLPAAAAMERLYLCKTKSSYDDWNAVQQEWSERVKNSGNATWDKLYCEAVEANGLGRRVQSTSELRLSELADIWRASEISKAGWGRGVDLDLKDLEKRKKMTVNDLIAMRTSEILCERTGNYDLSPPAFPRGLPDPTWSKHSLRIGRGCWDFLLDKEQK